MPKTVGLKMVVETLAKKPPTSRWVQVGSETTAALHAKPAAHAEQKKFAEFGLLDNPILLVQNAFPCPLCHQFFLTQSAAPHHRAVIIKVEKDDGSYSLNHAPAVPANPGLPVLIYYFQGKATYRFKTPPHAPLPADFPDHPDFADQQYY